MRQNGHDVRVIKKQGLKYLVVDRYATVADNLEADPGMCYNVTAPLDFMPFEEEVEIARLVREVVTVGRVIVFGGTGNTMEDLQRAEEIKLGNYIGIASAKSKSYEHGYQCRHLGYGVDKQVQAPTILTNAGVHCTLIGKVADIVANDGGEYFLRPDGGSDAAYGSGGKEHGEGLCLYQCAGDRSGGSFTICGGLPGDTGDRGPGNRCSAEGDGGGRYPGCHGRPRQ